MTGEGAISDFTARNPDFAARVQKSFDAQGVMGYIGARLGSVRPGYCEIELPYSEAVSQQHGFFHGGIIGTSADSAAGYAAFSLMAQAAATESRIMLRLGTMVCFMFSAA